MAKYNAAKIEECEAWVAVHGLIDYGGAKLKEFVREMGIDEKTYRLWMKGKPQFKEAIERAKEVFKQNLTHDLAISLSKAAKGYEHEETEQEFRVGADEEEENPCAAEYRSRDFPPDESRPRTLSEQATQRYNAQKGRRKTDDTR